MGDRSEFEQMMAEYKSNYVEFLATGNEAYKTAYRNAQDAIEKMVSARQAQVESQKKDMQQFVASYEAGNEAMGGTVDEAAELHANAQAIEDDYLAAKNRYDLYREHEPTVPSVNISNGYAMVFRFGIVLLLLPILFLIAYWSPQMNPWATSAIRPGQPFTMNITSPMVGPMSPR